MTDNEIRNSGVTEIEMTDKEFNLLSKLIYSSVGIKMAPIKKQMLSSRLNKRLKSLNIGSYDEYYNYICSGKGQSDEYIKMIDAVTTNKTDFFREPAHFNILFTSILPELVKTERFTKDQILNFWSAGCSTGEEPYSIAMLLSDFFSGDTRRFRILATDISMKVIQAAADAVYSESTIKPVSEDYKKKYMLKGVMNNIGQFRIVPEIRKRITFRYLNLMEKYYNLESTMDVVFCRNVIIYFDKETQKNLFRKIYEVINPGGYLFIGSSETLFGINDMFKMIQATVYRKR